jgi:hypothetical protein
MCDERGKLVTSHAVVARSPKVGGQLLRPIERDQRGYGGNAAIARAQCGIGPDVAIIKWTCKIIRLNAWAEDYVAWGASMP